MKLYQSNLNSGQRLVGDMRENLASANQSVETAAVYPRQLTQVTGNTVKQFSSTNQTVEKTAIYPQ